MSFRPLVINQGRIQQLPSGQALDVDWLIPAGDVYANSVFIINQHGTVCWTPMSANQYLCTDGSGHIVTADKPFGVTMSAPTADKQVLQATGVGTAGWTLNPAGLTSVSASYLVASVYVSAAKVGIGSVSFGARDKLLVDNGETDYSLGATLQTNSALTGIGNLAFLALGNVNAGVNTGCGVTFFAKGTDTVVQNIGRMGCMIETAGASLAMKGKYVFAVVSAGAWVTVCEMLPNGTVWVAGDNRKLMFGADKDASFYYNGTDLYCNPKEVGVGKFVVLGAIVADNLPSPTADNQILQATGAGTANWTTDVQTLTSLVVDNLTLNGSTVSSTADLYFSVASGNIHFDGTALVKFRDLADLSNTRIQINLANTRTQFYGPDEVEYVRIEPFSGGQIWSKVPIRILADNVKATYGTDSDASFYYNGTNFYCNPKEVGSGKFIVLGEMEVINDLVVNGISVTQNIQIGGSDVCRVLDEDRTYYVRTTGNDSTGDGSVGTPFATVGRALDEIYKWVADENTITIDVGAGTFSETTLSPTYAYGASLYVTGVAETHVSGCAVSSIGSVTALETGLEYIDFVITLPSGYTTATGQYIACKTASGGTNNHLVLGVHKVVGWDAGTRAATVRCIRRAGVTAVPSGAISLTDIRVIKTVLSFASGNGIDMSGAYHGGNWDKLVLAGNSTGYGANLVNGSSLTAGDSFGTSDWNYNVFCAGNGSFFGDSTCHAFCRGSLIRVQNGGVSQIRYGTVLNGARTTGLFCFIGGTIAAYQIQMATCGNADGVLCYQGGFTDVSSGFIRDGNPTGTGCNANRGGGIDATSATISGYASSTSAATSGYVIT